MKKAKPGKFQSQSWETSKPTLGNFKAKVGKFSTTPENNQNTVRKIKITRRTGILPVTGPTDILSVAYPTLGQRASRPLQPLQPPISGQNRISPHSRPPFFIQCEANGKPTGAVLHRHCKSEAARQNCRAASASFRLRNHDGDAPNTCSIPRRRKWRRMQSLQRRAT